VPGQPLGLDRSAPGRGSSSSGVFARTAGDGFVRPALRNTEGDPLVLCETTLKTGDAVT
jgi:hypothetical protein